MATLKEKLGEGEARKSVIVDACDVLDKEVDDKGGLGGVAIRGAYSIVKGIKPGFVPEVIDGLLDDFLEALEPIFQEAQQRGVAPGKHLTDNSDRMAEALLAITDQRAERSSRSVIRKTYERLRPSAKKHVVSAAPRLGAMLDRHLR